MGKSNKIRSLIHIKYPEIKMFPKYIFVTGDKGMRKGQRSSRNMSETHTTGGPLVDVISLVVWEITGRCRKNVMNCHTTYKSDQFKKKIKHVGLLNEVAISEVKGHNVPLSIKTLSLF